MKTFSPITAPVRSLIIDDESDTCYLLGNILSRKKIENDFANNLAEGKRILENQYFDLIFLDNYLPDGNGVDFIPYLKKEFPTLKIILITANADQETRDKIKKKKIDFFMLKPLNTETINSAIDHILSKQLTSYVNQNNMEKLMITFDYNNEEYTAAVTKSTIGGRTDYAIHPTSPKIIQLFGSQITLFKENESFTINTAKDQAYKEYVDALTNALLHQDKP